MHSFLLDTCTCSTPGEGTVDKNEFICTNGQTGHCSSDQECYATEAFKYGEWDDGCRVSCECSTPGTGTEGKNEIKCSNGETRNCSSEEECYATEKFTYGEWSDGCRIPVCECTTPGAGTAGNNQMTCSNGETRYCSADKECYSTGTFTYGEWNDGCRIPGD